MTLSLPVDLTQFVEEQLAAGKFQSSEEIVCAALRLLREKEQQLAALRADIDAGIAQLDAGQKIEVRDEAALSAFFDDIEIRGKQRLAAVRAT